MATNQLPIDGLAASAKKIVMAVTLNTPTAAELPLVLGMPDDWTLKQLLVTSNNASVDVDFSILVNGTEGTGYDTVTYDDNSSVGTVTADLNIDAADKVSLDLVSVTSPGIISFTLIGEYR